MKVMKLQKYRGESGSKPEPESTASLITKLSVISNFLHYTNCIICCIIVPQESQSKKLEKWKFFLHCSSIPQD